MEGAVPSTRRPAQKRAAATRVGRSIPMRSTRGPATTIPTSWASMKAEKAQP